MLFMVLEVLNKEKVSLIEAFDLPENVIGNLKWLIPMAQDETLRFVQPITLEEERRIE